MPLLQAPSLLARDRIILQFSHNMLDFVLEVSDVSDSPVDASDALCHKLRFFVQNLVQVLLEFLLLGLSDEAVEQVAGLLVDVILALGDQLLQVPEVLEGEDDVSAGDELQEYDSERMAVQQPAGLRPLGVAELLQAAVGMTESDAFPGLSPLLGDREQVCELGLCPVL